MKKIFIVAAIAAVVAGLVFVACKKEITNTDKVATEQVVKHQQMHKLMAPDTIYIGGEYGDRNSYCEGPGYGCLQGVTVRAVGRTLENIQDVFPKINDYLNSGDLVYRKGYLSIPEDKIYVMNEILVKIM